MTIKLLTEPQVLNLKLQLISQQQTLQLQLLQSDDAAKPVTLDQQSVGRVSRIDAIQQQQMASANRSQTIALLQQIDIALKRIESDQYGLCQICDEPIALPRLQAQPHAANCIVCQSKQEDSS
ncbi:MAG: DnaK suppressor protein [Candidatus Azotimanducaceae bacterium]|jgi:DnaK suppressor protein